MSEFNWIEQYFAPLATRKGAAGLVDDVAELSGKASIVTVDALVEGVHFLPTDPIDTVARKLVRVNVSDLIAKGARPDEALLTLGWPKERDEVELAQFAKAFGEELGAWGISLIGGDTVTSPDVLFLSLTLTGRVPEGAEIIRRSGARMGDILCVTGVIGLAGPGMADAKAGHTTGESQHYQVPNIPPLEVADFISGNATAAMDISDGLLADTQKLIKASKCGARLYLDKVPTLNGTGTLDWVMAGCVGGDDYQSLFTLTADVPASVLSDLPVAVTVIGRIEEGGGLKLQWHGDPVPLPEKTGFEHS